MAIRQKYPLLNLRGTNYEVAEVRVPGEKRRIIIEDNFICDYKCFQKSKKERELLKIAKAQSKLEEMKRVICK